MTFAGAIPMLRRRLRENVRLALGTDLAAEAESRYFRQMAWWLSNAIATFHHGVGATPVLNEIMFDKSIELFATMLSRKGVALLLHPHIGQATNLSQQKSITGIQLRFSFGNRRQRR